MKHFITALATTDDCVLNMCVSVYTSFPLESVMLAGGRGLVLGGLQLTPQGLQGYSASALCQILRLFSLLALSDGVTDCLTGKEVQEWLLAACLPSPLRA